MYPRLASNSKSYCLRLLSVGITAMCCLEPVPFLYRDVAMNCDFSPILLVSRSQPPKPREVREENWAR